MRMHITLAEYLAKENSNKAQKKYLLLRKSIMIYQVPRQGCGIVYIG